MKRILTFASALVLIAGTVFADQNVLIDFAKLTSDIQVSGQDENKQTLMDFSHATIGASFTDEQRSRLKTSLLLKNWVVELTSSSQTVVNNSLSFTKESTSKAFFEGPVLGVRVHFPVEPFQSWALIKPPFEIPAYDFQTVNDDGSFTPAGEDVNFKQPTRFEGGFGVIKNVGAIKSIAVNVYGLNFPHLLSVVFVNDLHERKIMPIGYLNYDGWAQLTWENPAYIEHVRARTMRLYPLYPASSNYIKFAGFLIQRDAAGPGGDFVTYFKDVQVIYDKAVLDPEGADIDDESEWHVLRDREASRSKHESERFGVEQVLRFIEEQKRATEAWSQTGIANQQTTP